MALTDLGQTQRLGLAWLKPIYLVHIYLSGRTLLLSDRLYKYTYGSTTEIYEPYIADMTEVAAKVGDVRQARNASFDLKLLNDPNGSPAQSFLFCRVSIYEVRAISEDETFSSDVKTLLWTGYIEKVKAITQESFHLTCSSRLYYLRDSLNVNKVNLTDFPSADPDDVGKQRNILYGYVEHTPCLAIKAGVIDTLAADITDTATTIYISGSSISEFPTGSFTVQIDTEKIDISSRSGNTLTVSARGASGTTATDHNKGAYIAEVLSEYIYEVASHPVKSISHVFVDDVRQTAGYTAYTGQSGDELTGYEGTSVIKFDTLPVVKKQVNLNVNQGSHTHNITSNSEATKNSWPTDADEGVVGDEHWLNPDNTIDGSSDSYANCSLGANEVAYDLKFTHGMTNLGQLVEQYVHVEVEVDYIYSGTVLDLHYNGKTVGIASGTKAEKRVNVTDYMSWNPSEFYIKAKNTGSTSSVNFYVYRVWVESVYNIDPTASASPATGVALYGNSSADTVIGRMVTANVEGYQDDANGTYTGTANALIERPDHVIKHMLTALANIPMSDIGGSFSSSGALYSSAISGGYKLAFLANAISEKLDQILYTLAHDCRSLLYEFHGKFELVFLPDTVNTADVTISEDSIVDLPVYELSDVTEVKNRLNGYYRRDYRKVGDLGTAYMDMIRKQSGAGDMPMDIELKSVRISAMADDVIEWMLSQYQSSRKMVSVTTTWIYTDMSPVITFAIPAGLYPSTIFRLKQTSIDPKTHKIRLYGEEV